MKNLLVLTLAGMALASNGVYAASSSNTLNVSYLLQAGPCTVEIVDTASGAAVTTIDWGVIEPSAFNDHVKANGFEPYKPKEFSLTVKDANGKTCDNGRLTKISGTGIQHPGSQLVTLNDQFSAKGSDGYLAPYLTATGQTLGASSAGFVSSRKFNIGPASVSVDKIQAPSAPVPLTITVEYL